MINKNKKYIIACSGGPDSMALLDMCHQAGLNIICGHVNYHKRKTAKRDEKIVKDYCLKNNIPFYKKDYRDDGRGNFQEKARIFRYQFFNDLKNKYQCDEVLVAHHLDDLLETYFMQLKKNMEVAYYGLKKHNVLYGIKVTRPLLNYTKKDLEDYCLKNKIVYGLDESNLLDNYERNRIRHDKLASMSLKDKKIVLKEIKNKNKLLKEEEREIKKFINKRTRFAITELLNFKYLNNTLRRLLNKYLSKKYLEEIVKALKSKKNTELLVNNHYLVKEYGYIEVYEKEEDYCYTFSKIKYGKFKHFSLRRNGTSFEGVTLKADDYPITIRNYHEGDKILMRYGHKKISRFFIDNKIPSKDRKMWPIMFNKEGSAILVPKIGCDKHHYSIKHNVFMIK